MRSPKMGLTLIEVLAAITLVATLLAATTLAATRHARQLRTAQDRLQALEVADGLLTEWLIEGNGEINEAAGQVPGRPTWQWRLAGRYDTGLQPLGLHVGVLQILAPTDDSPSSPLAVLAEIEFASKALATAKTAVQTNR